MAKPATGTRTRLIICNADEVRGILNGRLTELWRAMKPQPVMERGIWRWRPRKGVDINVEHINGAMCPLGQPGDLLRLRETWRCTGGGDEKGIVYRADEKGPSQFQAAYRRLGLDELGRRWLDRTFWDQWEHLVYETDRCTLWRSPATMPRWASRLTLEVVTVKVSQRDSCGWLPGVRGL